MTSLPQDAQRLLAQLASYPDGIVVIDKTGNVCYANPSAQLFFGTGRGMFVGSKWAISVLPGEAVEYENGGRTVEICAAATTWGGDNAVLLAVREITTRKRKELVLLESERRLAAALDNLKLALASEKVLFEELDRKNKELLELSITDGLTGLYNHRYIQERLEFEFKRVRRYGGNLSCLMIDIDHFKNLNDTYGHQCGDFVLREISGLLRTSSREVDICGRYGGEEFLILTHVPLESTIQYATKLHSAIEKNVFAFEGKTLHVTVSIGIADFRTDMKDRHDLVERADVAMYQAKNDGRNLIRTWKVSDGGISGRAGAQEHQT